MEKDTIILDIKLFLQLIFQIKSPAHKQNQAHKIRQHEEKPAESNEQLKLLKSIPVKTNANKRTTYQNL